MTKRAVVSEGKKNPTLKDVYSLLQVLAVKVTGLEQEVGSLKQEVGSLKQEVGSLKQEVGSLKQEVGSLKQEVGSLKSSMEELTKRVNHIDAELSSFKESVKDRFDIVNKKFDGIDKRFDSIDKRFETTDIHIGGLEHAVLAQTEDIIDLKNGMTRVETRLETMDQKFTLEIRELRVEIRDRVIVRIDNHEGRIYNLERRPAS